MPILQGAASWSADAAKLSMPHRVRSAMKAPRNSAANRVAYSVRHLCVIFKFAANGPEREVIEAPARRWIALAHSAMLPIHIYAVWYSRGSETGRLDTPLN